MVYICNQIHTIVTQTKFLLQQVIDDLIESRSSLVGPLMKLNYFGRLSKNEELIDFTGKEINGYSAKETNIPEYRKTLAKLMVDVQAARHRHTVEIPITMLEEPLNKALRYLDAREGISTIENMALEMSKNQENEFYRPLPLEMLPYIQPALDRLYRSNTRLNAVGARLYGNGNLLLEIPNHIRTKLLEFVMTIAERLGYDIENLKGNPAETNKIINNIMHQTINSSGNGNIVNTGDNNSLTANFRIQKGDKRQLAEKLLKNGLEAADIDELINIIDKEEPKNSTTLGEKANKWIAGIVEKSLNGIGKISNSITSNILATIIKGYYGMD
jgi:hypothetical protein